MRILAAFVFSLAFALPALSQPQDFPLRVGRIAHIEGSASIYQDAEYGWEKAYVNTPITSENSVWTDQGSRAEVRVSGIAIRLDRLTQFDVARLDEDQLDAFVARGSIALRVRHYETNERLTFNTPNARVRIRQDGRYRIDVDPDRLETRVTVLAGEARIGTEEGRIRVGPGRSVLVFGDDPQFVEESARNDGFDRWVLTRDERWREGRAPTYVSTYMTGYEDLDQYGTWAAEPEYGALWYPRQVSAEWAPYRYGRWDYVRPWGWTWVDDAPWGYAPFHYGRWVYVRDRWAWHPGERIARPVWAPALVAFVGGANWSVGVSSAGPAVGWYPLSPWDRYDPWFQANPTYVQRVNVMVQAAPQRDDRRRWREWTRERGTTVVNRTTLVEQRPVQQALVRVPIATMQQAPVVTRPEAVLPTRNDVIARRRQQPAPAVATPVAPPAVAQAPRQSGERGQQPAARSAIVRPDFGRNAAVVATPRQASAPPAERGNSPIARGTQREQEQAQAARVRESQAQERAQREQQQAAERTQRDQQQAQERAAREQQQQQRNALERQQRDQQQAQQKAQRDQEQAQRQAQERQQREQQQAQQKAQRDQEQAQRQQQERAQREQQQAQQKAQRDQEQAQRQAQERAQREQQQAQQKAQQQQAQAQQQAQERAQREQQQQAQRQAQQQAQQQQQAAERQRGRDKDKEKDDDEEKGKGKGNKP